MYFYRKKRASSPRNEHVTAIADTGTLLCLIVGGDHIVLFEIFHLSYHFVMTTPFKMWPSSLSAKVSLSFSSNY